MAILPSSPATSTRLTLVRGTACKDFQCLRRARVTSARVFGLRRFAARSSRYRSTMDPRVTADCARASIFSICGSWPRCTLESALFARLRASSALSVSTVPSVTRRCFVPTRYWTIHVRLPPSRRRSPKSGQGSVKYDFVIHASGKRQPFDIRLGEPHGKPRPCLWEAHGKQPCDRFRMLMLPNIRGHP